MLRQKGLQLAVAESCTGGLIEHLITNVAGSSEYFLGGVVAYAYEAKERLLGVRRNTLTTYGAVSRETVLEMALGVRQAVGADIGISASGIAGPGGGMPNKPVGLVWIGVSGPRGDRAFQFIFHGNRVENKADSARKALELLRDYLQEVIDAGD